MQKKVAMVVRISSDTAKFIKYWIPVIIYAILIYCVSGLPGEDIPQVFSFQDIPAHIIEYAAFAFLISRAFKAYATGLIFKKRFLWVFFLAFIYALTDEWHQSFVPSRFPSFYDLAYDGVGIVLANFFYR